MYMYKYMCVCVYKYMCVCVYMNICVCVYTYIYVIYIYMCARECCTVPGALYTT